MTFPVSTCLRSSVMSVTGIAVAALLAATTGFASTTDPDIPRLQTSAAKGVVAQQVELAADYFVGRGVPQDEKLAAHWYQRAAEAGDPAAQNQIGYFYQLGIGVPVDKEKAVHWYQLAAANGLMSAKVNLGVAYVWGLGVPKNEAFGADLFRQAVSKGNGTGASYLGDLYYFGIGVKRDQAEAIKWYEKGAKLHSPFACYDLGIMYSVGDDHAHDFAKAAVLLRESASEGFVPAMHSLAQLVLIHPELARSSDEALSLLTQAASAGAWKASVMLGIVNRDGMGVPADNKEAYLHFKIAALQGGEPVQRLFGHDLRSLSAKVGAEQTAALDKAAENWYQQHRRVLSFIFKDGDNRKLFPAFAIAAFSPGEHAGQLIAKPEETEIEGVILASGA
jgi:uncharacterized protein